MPESSSVTQNRGTADQRGRQRDERPAVVVGGGIGGLATALALARTGQAVRVLEREPAFTEVGAGIQLAPNATRILRKLGAMQRIDRTAVYPDRLEFRSAESGESLLNIDLGEAFRQRYGAPYIVMHRHDVLDALLGECQEHDLVTLETGRDVTTVEDQGDYVEVGCAAGSELQASFVVGADGLHSKLRDLISGTGGPVPTSAVSYRGTVSAEALNADDLDHAVVAWLGPDIDFVRYPLRRGELYNQVASFRSEAFASGLDRWGEPEELERRFACACDTVQRGLALIDRGRNWLLNSGEPLQHWVCNRVALVGDAAHPMWQYLAQGGCQALQDADTLADSIVASESISAGLAAYERMRAPHTAMVQGRARVWGDVWHLGGAGAAVRDELFKTIAPTDYERLDWLYLPSQGTGESSEVLDHVGVGE